MVARYCVLAGNSTNKYYLKSQWISTLRPAIFFSESNNGHLTCCKKYETDIKLFMFHMLYIPRLARVFKTIFHQWVIS